MDENVERIAPKYFIEPNWRNGKGEVHHREVFSWQESESSLVRNLNIDSKKHQSILREIPYSVLVPMSEEVYGKDLYLGQRVLQEKGKERMLDVYDILTSEGVVIGRFRHDFFADLWKSRTYMLTNFRNALLPRECFKDLKRESFEEIVSKYCASYQDAIKYIPKQTYKKFPKLSEMIDGAVEARKSPTESKRTQELLKKSRTKSDGGKA